MTTVYIAAPEAGGILEFERADNYYLLGDHIIGVYWDDNNTTVFDAGTTADPLVGDYIPDEQTSYLGYNGTGMRGLTVAEGPNRLGVWNYDKLRIIEFEDVDADTLTVAGTEEREFPVDYNANGFTTSVESNGRPFFESWFTNENFVVNAHVESGAVVPEASVPYAYPLNYYQVYDAILTIPFPVE